MRKLAGPHGAGRDSPMIAAGTQARETTVMRKVLVTAMVAASAAVILLALGYDTANARMQYKMQWEKTYMTKDSAISKAYEGKATCNVCHQGAKSRKNRNPYAKAIEKALGGKNVKDAEKISAALAEAAKAKSGGNDSPTFGDLIERGEWKMTTAEP
ncbi:MAG: hypothetical protein HYS13_00635 [Planctomycetia bacterium]|nr:hypothetical protein [Planctomycetia bacterium]